MDKMLEGECLGGAEGGWPAGQTALAALDAALLLALVAVNTLVLAAVAATRGPAPGGPGSAARRASRRLVANLAAADAFVGLSTLYFLSFRYWCAANALLAARRWTCLSRFVLICYSHLTSAYAVAAVALDRYVAVVHALRYSEIMSYRRTTALLATAWLLPALSSGTLLAWNHWRPGVPCSVEAVLPLPFVAGVGALSHGTLLAVVAATHVRVHRVAAAALRRDRGPAPGLDSGPGSASDRSRSGRTVTLLAGCYFVCWGPYMVLYLARAASAPPAGGSTGVLDVPFRLAHTFANLNYLVNPFMYAWRNAEVRRAIVGACRRLAPKKRPRDQLRQRLRPAAPASALPPASRLPEKRDCDCDGAPAAGLPLRVRDGAAT